MEHVFGQSAETQATLHEIQQRAWQKSRRRGPLGLTLDALLGFLQPRTTNWLVFAMILLPIASSLMRHRHLSWHLLAEQLASALAGLGVTALLIGFVGWYSMERRFGGRAESKSA